MKQYIVAEHLFSIEAPETLFGQMPNFTPFEVHEAAGKPIFTLTIHEPEKVLPSVKPEWETVYDDISEEDMPLLQIFRHSEGWVLLEAPDHRAPICLMLTMSPDFSSAHLYMLCNTNPRFAVDNATMLLFAFATASLSTLEVHASVTVRGDYGYLFLGKSGTGKSTHSQQWLKAFPDAWLLNDDNPIIRLKEDGVYVYGSPWSGKTPCYKNDVRRVGAFVKLLQAPYNKMHTLRLPEAYAYILSSSSGLKIIPEIMDSLYATMSRLVQTVPVYGLECLPDTAAAHLCAETVMK